MKIKNSIKIATAFLVGLNSFSVLVMANESTNSSPSTKIKTSKLPSDFAHFSFPIDTKAPLKSVHQNHNTSSDEYWFQVSGAQLNKGVLINTTQANALIRITQGYSNKAQRQASELDTSLLKLSPNSSVRDSAIGQIISKNQLAELGVFDNTVVLKTNSKITAGILELKTSQSLNSDDIYMISVKEKGSKYRLNLDMSAQSFTEKDVVKASAKILNGDKVLKPNNLKATLVAPNGKKSPLSYSINKQGLVFLEMTPPKDIIAPINGLYEIKIEASGMANNLKVQRNAKLALAFSNHSARLTKVSLEPQATYASLNVIVKQNSRFEVRGILYGTNYDGQLIPVMETHAAKTLDVGLNAIRLPFNLQILSKSKVTAPFELRSVRLFDQEQLGLIDTLATSVKAF